MYDDTIPRSLELSGAAVLRGLLEKYGQLLSLTRAIYSRTIRRKTSQGFGNNLDCSRLLLNDTETLTFSCVHDKTTDADEWCLRAHMIVDFLSGMTGQFALTSYQRLSGIRFEELGPRRASDSNCRSTASGRAFRGRADVLSIHLSSSIAI